MSFLPERATLSLFTQMDQDTCKSVPERVSKYLAYRSHLLDNMQAERLSQTPWTGQNDKGQQ